MVFLLVNGVVVREVIPNTAADNAGIKANDILVKVNEEPINSREEFIILVSSLAPGSEVKVLLVRDGSEMSVKANLGTRPRPKE